jgi:hypothetical protein
METPIKNPSARYSTKEVAARLFLSELRTRHLLLAAGVPCSKAGAAYLWDAAAVDRLIATLGKEPSSGTGGVA